MNNNNEKFNFGGQLPESVKELVIVRLSTMPSGYVISVGSHGSFTKDELIEHVEKNDEVGMTMVKVELEFLNALKTGKLLNQLVGSEK